MLIAKVPGGGTFSTRLTRRTRESYQWPSRVCSKSAVSCSRVQLKCETASGNYNFSLHKRKLVSPVITRGRKPFLRPLHSKLRSDCDVDPCDVEYSTLEEEEDLIILQVVKPDLPDITTNKSPSRNVKSELIWLSLPAIVGQALEPMAQLMETAHIGRLGPVELGSAAVSITIINIISKLFNIPLLSVSTSLVAEDISRSEESVPALNSHEEIDNGKPFYGRGERKQLSSVSTALLLAIGIGIFEGLVLLAASGKFLDLMGVSLDSPMRAPAQKFLTLRALGAPAVVVSLALQGVLRGFKDTKTPTFCQGAGNVIAIFLFPMLMYGCKLGFTGAAIATVLSQYIVSILMVWFLSKRAILLPPDLRGLRFDAYLKSGGFLLGRTLSVLITMTIGASMAARQGPIAMSAHQICLQVWLAVSLLTDALATSSQAIIASSFSRGDFVAVKDVSCFVLKIGVLLGTLSASVLGVSFGSVATWFTNDMEVLEVAKKGILFVAASQPINSLAFIFDGLHYGVSDFRYAAYSMMVVGAISSAVLLYAPPVIGLRGVWLGLTVFMGLRMVAGVMRLLNKNGPWWFLHSDVAKLEVIN